MTLARSHRPAGRGPRSLLAAAALGLGACVGAGQDPSAPPVLLERADAQDLSPVMVLEWKLGHRFASGVAVAPDLLLTAAHFLDGIPQRDGVLWLDVDGTGQSVRVVARGRSEAEPPGDAPDWAVLQLIERRFPPEVVARLHAPALRPDWTPPAGTPLWIAGFAAIFFPDRRMDLSRPTPALRTEAVDVGLEDGTPHLYALGDEQDLGGLSGGGVFVRDATGHPELVGIFVARVPVETRSTVTTRVLGVPVGAREVLGQEWWCCFERLPAEWLPIPPRPRPGTEAPGGEPATVGR